MKIGSLSFVIGLIFLSQLLFLEAPLHSGENYADPIYQFIPEKKLLAKFKIRSLAIYADLSEDGVDKSSYVLTGKIREMEFDENGNLTYVLSPDEDSYYPFITYGGESRLERYTYDHAQRLIIFYSENATFQHAELMTYDSDGNLSSMEIMRDKTILIKEEYVWEKGKMIESKITASSELNSGTINEYDESGRALKHVSNNRTIIYSRIFSEDSTETTIEIFASDTLQSTQTFVTLAGINKMSHYVYKNHKGELLTEKKSAYDEHGNLTYYYLNDLSNKYHGNNGLETYPPSTFKISNEYDHRGLVIKRLFYYSREDVGTDILIRVEKMFYDTQQLLRKMENGSISKINIEPTTESEPEYACEGACESGNE